jgi:glycosyltransferase involved in cell wall biosynthesis
LTDVRPFLRQLDLFVMISEPAGCPNASLEALATGLPVIATDFGGASEQIERGVSGLLTPRGDAAALADAIVAAARDPTLRARLGENGRRRVEERFSLERMVADYLRICLPASAARGDCHERDEATRAFAE